MYCHMLKTGEITPFGLREFHKMLRRVKHKNLAEARTLLILLYYLGHPVSEILRLLPNHVDKQGSYIRFTLFQTSRGEHTTVLLLPDEADISEAWEYIRNKPPYFVLFHDFISSSVVTVKLKKTTKQYQISSEKVKYWVKKWGKAAGYDIVPSYFVHNRLKKLGEVLDIQHLLYWRGTTTLKSVERYMPKKKKLVKLALKVKPNETTNKQVISKD